MGTALYLQHRLAHLTGGKMWVLEMQPEVEDSPGPPGIEMKEKVRRTTPDL